VSEFAADKEAPVSGREEVLVAAPPETVWDVISKIDEWPRWNADIKEARIVGTTGDDDLVGTAGRDVIVALEGRDVIHGLDGSDLICPGPGVDEAFGEAGED
jgi:uncharacterized protein YndB with AHSA1/START domain